MDKCENCGREFKLSALRYTTVPANWILAYQAGAHVDGRGYLCVDCRTLIKAVREG